MKKNLLFVAAAAAMFVACSSNDDVQVAQSGDSAPVQKDLAIGFDAYTQRSTTRGGKVGEMDIAALRAASADGGGFGVFAYYTDNNDYEQSRIPDFMYNQGVFYNGTVWTYSPIKYWPNEYGTNAISDDYDRVSYFAYAPYVESNGNGKVNGDKWGITGMSRNSKTGDPIIKYIASFEPVHSVDLLWGVCADTDTNWSLIQTNASQVINEGVGGLPWLNVQRPLEALTQETATQRIKFTFNHALAQLAVMIDAAVDDGDNVGNDLANGTKIYVRQINFSGVAMKGALNLNNEEPNKALWLDYTGCGDIDSGTPITVYDGLKDGKEGTVGANASNEKTLGFNPVVISNEGNTQPGVTKDPVNLFAQNNVMLIPTGEDLEIEIVYDVETADDNLAGFLSDGSTHGSSIENRIKKVVRFDPTTSGLQSGKRYTINLHLGMNSVKFDAAITDWDDTPIDQDAYLPSNEPA